MTTVRFSGLHLVNTALIPENRREEFKKQLAAQTRSNPRRGKEASIREDGDFLLINTRPAPKGLFGWLGAMFESDDSKKLKRRGERSLDRDLARFLKRWYAEVLETRYGHGLKKAGQDPPMISIKRYGDGSRRASTEGGIPTDLVDRYTEGLLPDEVKVPEPTLMSRRPGVTFDVRPKFAISVSETGALDKKDIQPLFERLKGMKIVRVLQMAQAEPVRPPRRVVAEPMNLGMGIAPGGPQPGGSGFVDPLAMTPGEIESEFDAPPPQFPRRHGKKARRDEGMLPVKQVHVRRPELRHPQAVRRPR